MSMRLYSSLLAVAVITFTAAACDRGDTRADTARTAVVEDSRTDEQLETYVQARYQSDPSIAANDIEVSARDGVVTLHGEVESAAARDQAASLAQQVEGVRSVDNQLRVEPTAENAGTVTPVRGVESGAATTAAAQSANTDRTPGWITTKIQAQYFVDTDLKPWNIDVTTRSDGTVTLNGEVDSADARQAAERIARETEGVTRVDNRLRVRGDRSATATADNTAVPPAPPERAANAEQPDEWVTAKIQAKYFMDSEVKGRQINVDTRDGVVTLTGQVENASERRQAVALASNTEGVTSVTDQLQVVAADADRAASSTPADRTNAQAVEDGWVTTIVQSKFFMDQDIKSRDINVDTRNGIVTLQGEVDSDVERRAAEQIALETRGVNRVVNQLVVTVREQQ